MVFMTSSSHLFNLTNSQTSISSVSLMNGLIERISSSVNWSSPSSVQFYELRLMFLITALRPELNNQLQKVVQPEKNPHALCEAFFLPQHMTSSCPSLCVFPPAGRRGVHPYGSLGEHSGGAVEGAVRVCAGPGGTTNFSRSLSAHHRNPQNPL